MEKEKCCGCGERHRARSDEEKRALENRLKRIEGQVKGVARMLREDRYCIDILTQVNAVSSALSAFSRELLSSHIRSCVINDIKEGSTAKVEELIEAVSGYIK